MSPKSIWKAGRFPACCLLLVIPLGILSAAGETSPPADAVAPPAELRIYETSIAISARVECRRYEGKVLNCTFDPSRAVRESLDVRLLLGYSEVTIDGVTMKLERDEGASVKFRPHGAARHKEFSGNRELKISVVYVN